MFNPFWEEKKIKNFADDKYKKKEMVDKFMRDIKNDNPRHDDSVNQVINSEYYLFYASISDEMIIYQLKEKV